VLAGGELWEKSPLSTGQVTETEAWGKVNLPTTHGRVVQVSAGNLARYNARWAK
jgi:hypothetical protein